MRINIAFHNIYTTASYNDDFGYELQGVLEILEFVHQLISKSDLVKEYQIYFDDGYRSLIDLVIPNINSSVYKNITAAITTQFVGGKEYLSLKEIKRLDSLDVNIVSHGVSHAALAIYDKETDSYILKTPPGGEYIDVPWGTDKTLRVREVEYQLLESGKFLERILGHGVHEFVFPFGLYNKATLKINERIGGYRFLTTCDFDLDDGCQLIRPRYLVYGNSSIGKIKKEILSKVQSYDEHV